MGSAKIAGKTSGLLASRLVPKPRSASTARRSSLPSRGLFIGSWRHLVGRFFRVVFAQPLSASEADWVRRYLDTELSAFFAQSGADQRHGYEAAKRVGERSEMVRAALLHDIGKRHAQLSPVLRSIVTAAAKLGLPVGRRGTLYLAHGRLAATELTQLGAEPLVIDFAAWHHHERPESINPEDWKTLVEADR